MWFYLPYLQLRSLHPCFFTATNPGIDTGGLGLESKYDTIVKIPEHLRPKTILARTTDDLSVVLSLLTDTGISFPIIAKPDIGYRGLLVKKINTPEQLKTYLGKYEVDFVLQEFITDLNEFGVLYHRLPWEKTGKITSLTLKEFLYVEGDGRSSVHELINNKQRAKLQLDRLLETHHHLMDTIPGVGEIVSLGIIGNHSKGTQFINGNKYIDQQLIDTFDKITNQIDGVYYGRYDIKCTNLEDLKAGKNIIILEINGVCSEPTHIYDAENTSYLKALKSILDHWKIIYKISKANRKRGVNCMPPLEMIQRFKNLKTYMDGLK